MQPFVRYPRQQIPLWPGLDRPPRPLEWDRYYQVGPWLVLEDASTRELWLCGRAEAEAMQHDIRDGYARPPQVVRGDPLPWRFTRCAVKGADGSPEWLTYRALLVAIEEAVGVFGAILDRMQP